MQPIDVSKRTVGVNFNEAGAAVISVWAPKATEVTIVTNTISIPLEKGAYGFWNATTTELKENDRYKIKLDDNDPLPDPASLSQPEGVHGGSVALNLALLETAAGDWVNPPLEEYIIYELHIGTFSAAGTFAGIIEKLDYLKELGITAIEIMPIAQFPGSRNWGYDGVYPYAAQDSYGGAKGLKELVDACHQKGLAVILDVVYNHVGPEGAYFYAFGPFFTSKYGTPWGQAINFDDAWCDGVRKYFLENALMWFRDFGIDALRLDAVHAIRDLSAVHFLLELRLRVDELMQLTGTTHYLLAELDLNDPSYIEPVANGGYGMDAQWIDEFHHALRVTTGQAATGYYSDFKSIAELAKTYRDAYVYDGQFSPHRKKFFGKKTEATSGKQFIVFSQNHDQVGNRMLGERTSQLLSFSAQKLVAAAVILSPYIPLLFMGEEWSEPAPFLYFVSHTDEELCKGVREGRKREFEAFHHEGEALDPVAEATFQQSKLQWDLLQQDQHRTMYLYYKRLLQLRKSEPALKNLQRDALTVDLKPDEIMIVLHRSSTAQKIICLLNFSSEERLFTLDDLQHWQLLLDSESAEWGGRKPVVIKDQTVQVQPESFVLLSNQVS